MGESLFKSTDRVILKESDVQAWRAERDKLLRQMDEMQSRVAVLAKKLEAAALLVGEPVPAANPRAKESEVPERQSMSDAALAIAQQSNRTMRHDDIKAELSKDAEFRRMLENSPNYYYTMISRLIKRGQLLKDGEGFRAARQN